MMNTSDIIQLVIVCAIIFFPLGYLARHSLRRIRDTTRLLFAKPRYVKPAGTLKRATHVKANRKHD
ncbi:MULTISPECIES: cellulose biosynthesis protein BcsF [Enterobacteriaceae]|uniref:Cellulose biosynthesis protein BcsF n=2 Tax=Gammaproteobacteria TaxID=1236 RepID=A0A8I0CZF5_9PSED|nr:MULTISPECIES: cellulose biosynthesis protein BcsF [Enterobacteriaceae]UJD96525.1 cellulose biosynthesis protein BcsF [Lelliottia amnigena]